MIPPERSKAEQDAVDAFLSDVDKAIDDAIADAVAMALVMKTATGFKAFENINTTNMSGIVQARLTTRIKQREAELMNPQKEQTK